MFIKISYIIYHISNIIYEISYLLKTYKIYDILYEKHYKFYQKRNEDSPNGCMLVSAFICIVTIFVWKLIMNYVVGICQPF